MQFLMKDFVPSRFRNSTKKQEAAQLFEFCVHRSEEDIKGKVYFLKDHI